MAHPKVTRRVGKRIYHLEDEKLSKVEAKSLKKHLIKTEDKRATITNTNDGYKVWWARK
jgi:hypothetical protein